MPSFARRTEADSAPLADIDASLPAEDNNDMIMTAENSSVRTTGTANPATAASTDGTGVSRDLTPSPVSLSCYIARQIFYADAITVQTVFSDNDEDDVLDELVFRIFSTMSLSHLLNKIERYRGLMRDSCVFYHHGRQVARGIDFPLGMYFHCCRNFIIKLNAHVRGGPCTRNYKRFLKAQDYRKGMFY